MQQILFTSQRWERIGEEYRTLADGARHEQARAIYLKMAEDADRLARQIAETEAAIEKSSKRKPR